MEQRNAPSSSASNLVLFLMLAFGIVLGNLYLTNRLNPPPKVAADAPAADQHVPAKPDDQPQAAKKEPVAGGVKPQEPVVKPDQPEQPEKPAPEGPKIAAGQPKIPPQWFTLGSADPADPYRMLVTFTNQGAAVVQIELNDERFRDLMDREGYLAQATGYLGDVVMQDGGGGSGCPVQVVGPGTPADSAGLEPGDVITALDGKKIGSAETLRKALETTEPAQKVELEVLRQDKTMKLAATLGRRPLRVVRPEGTDPLSFPFRQTLPQDDDDVARPEATDPLSFLLTLQQVDDQQLSSDDGEETAAVGEELAGLDLWSGTWQCAREKKDAAGDRWVQVGEDEKVDARADDVRIRFWRKLSQWDLEISKIFHLAKVPQESLDDRLYKAYHLVLDVEIRNTGQKTRKVAYQLDGPTGLPIEGWWYANKISRQWGAAGLRDVVVSFKGAAPGMVGCPTIADGDCDPPWQSQPLSYLGVDAQYFSAVLIPRKENPDEIWFAQSHPLRVGPVDKDRTRLTNTSCRVISQVEELAPGGALAHSYEVFAGPKRPDLLEEYELEELVYYGWFGPVAKVLLGCLHFFYWVIPNYGLAVIILTVLVRSCMFPLSRKQALGAQKMQELQPEIKRLQEKYKKDLEARAKAQRELFRKHNYNPASGCLVLFLQLPIFIGLYRGLMVDIELRQAPLLGEWLRWCSNLSAPDMLFDWSGWMPEFVSRGVGMFALGPYFNILPLLTVVMFLMQQKMFMPPPTDDQQAMQQKIMKYMMLFMGILFFKVASGLCLYFVASSLWGVAERKLLPKPKPAAATAKPRPKPAKPTPPRPPQAGSDGDGALPRKKKRRKSRGRR